MSGAGIAWPEWSAPPGVRAAFTLRTGGVSAEPYGSLNLGVHVGDDPAAVARNRALVREALALPAEPVWLDQVHGTDVVDLDALDVPAADAAAATAATTTAAGGAGTTAGVRPRGDAAITRQPGRVAVIQVADCMPVLFATRSGDAVGAAHAGWRGLAAGVLEATVAAMGAEPSQLVAWLGPGIGPRHFEVGEEVREAFLAADDGAGAAFAPSPAGRWLCDLELLARRRLRALRIGDIAGGGWCTYADAERCFSYRRQGTCGRMAALVWIVPSTR